MESMVIRIRYRDLSTGLHGKAERTRSSTTVYLQPGLPRHSGARRCGGYARKREGAAGPACRSGNSRPRSSPTGPVRGWAGTSHPPPAPHGHPGACAAPRHHGRAAPARGDADPGAAAAEAVNRLAHACRDDDRRNRRRGPRRTLGGLREYFRGLPLFGQNGTPAHAAASGPAEGRFLSRRGTVLFVVMGIIWGIPYLLIKVADGAVAVPVLVWSRVVIGALILVPVALAQGAWRPPQRALLRRNWHWLAAYALIEIIVPWALLSSAERRLPSSASGLLIASVPAIGALLAWLTRSGDRLTAVRAAGLGLGLAGVVLLAGPGAVHGDLLADAEVMGTAVCYAAPLIANRHLTGVPSIAANAACLSLAAVVSRSRRRSTGRMRCPLPASCVPRGARGGLHGRRARVLLLAYRGDRGGPGHRRHVRQPGRGRRARRAGPRGAVHRGDRRVVRPHPGRLGAGHSPGATAGERLRRRFPVRRSADSLLRVGR